ncbi:MAG: hypothetical protein KAI24_02820 [Planctomycetes bacterium]|nr:hypothetical protein [Planctomycetota bacterium]
MQSHPERGPSLRDASPDDDEAVRAVLAEQRAMIDVVRANQAWNWLGGMPGGFGHPKAALYGLYLAIAFVVSTAIALVVAGFDRGVWLGTFVGLALLCLLVRWLAEGSARRQTLAFYRGAVPMPAVVVAVGEPDLDADDLDDDDEPPTPVVVLVGPAVASADDLAALLAAGRRLRDGVRRPDACEPALRDVAADLREPPVCDGSRRPAPDALGSSYELAFVPVYEYAMPEQRIGSQLLFVFADPDDRGAGRTRVCHYALWGPGALSLHGKLPLGEVA